MTAFTRPALTKCFCGLGVVVAAGGSLMGIAIAVGVIASLPNGMASLAWLGGLYGWMIAFGSVVYGAVCWAIGYAIELLAQTAWNTHPENMAQVFQSAVVTVTESGGANSKRFFIEERGALRGPYSAADMMRLYRDGKRNPVVVEEAGQRRPMRDWSEIGL